MEAQPPFPVTKISKRPIVTASEVCDLMPMDRDNILSYKANVVFPAGCIETKDGWVVSVGVNDSSCLLLKVTANDLHL